MRASSMRNPHPSIGTPAELLQTATPWDRTWVPTVIAPFQKGGLVSKTFFWLHLLCWVVTVIITGIANGGAFFLQRHTTDCTPADESCFKTPVATFTGVVGWVSITSLIFAISMLLVSAAVWKIDQARREVEYYMILNFFSFVSLVGSFYIYIKSAQALSSTAFYLSTAGVVLHVYSNTLLYACTAAMKMISISRTNVPMFATALSILVACAIQLDEISLGETWDTGKPIRFAYGQKFASFLVPSFQLTGILSMVVLRRVTADEDNLSDIENQPFIRTTILFCFFFSACVNVYVYSFARMDTDMASGMLAMASMLMSSFSVLVVFAPNSKGVYASKQYDWAELN